MPQNSFSSRSHLATIRVNATWLVLIQLGNALTPIIAAPLLIRQLGLRGWGEISFALVVLQILSLVTDYGLSFSAVRRISANEDFVERQEIFYPCWIVQWLILLIELGALCLATAIFNWPPLISIASGFLVIIGNVLVPIWYFQAQENLNIVAISQLIGRAISLTILFLIDWSQASVNEAIVVISSGSLISAGFFHAFTRGALFTNAYIPTWDSIKHETRYNFGFFSSRFAIYGYTSFIPLVLGIVCGPTAVGLYSIADRIKTAATYIISPITQAMLPRSSSIFRHSFSEGINFVKKACAPVLAISTISAVILFSFSSELVSVFSGARSADAVAALEILSIVPIAVGLSNLLGMQILLPLGYERQFNKAIWASSGLAVATIYPAVLLAGVSGAAFVAVASEVVVVIGMAVCVVPILLRRGRMSPLGRHGGA